MRKALIGGLLVKKARTILLLLSIAFCGALVFSNEGFSQTVRAMIFEADTRWGGRSNLCISTWNTMGAKQQLEPEDFAPWKNDFEYTYFFTQTQAFYQPIDTDTHCFTVLGVDMEQFLTHNPFSLVEGTMLNSSGFEVIAGKTYAQKYGIENGDVISLEIGGRTADFTVVGIACTEGLFLRELADGGYLLVPQKTLKEMLGFSGNVAFVKLKNNENLADMRLQIAEKLPQYKVDYASNPAVITAEVNNYIVPFKAGSIFVIFMCAFIIYTSFNLITQERIQLLGILRSVGCSRKKANRIFLLESGGIGLLGGTIGCIIGWFLLLGIKAAYFGSSSTTPNVTLRVDFRAVLLAVLFSIFSTIAISLIPILKRTNQPIKSMILNDFYQKKTENSKDWIVGFIFCTLSFAGRFFLVPNATGMVAAIFLVIVGVVGMLLLLPRLGRLLSLFVTSAPLPLQLAARNVVDFKSLMNNTRLVASVISIMCLLLSLFGTLTDDLRSSYDKLAYDIQLSLQQADDESLAELKRINTVSDALGVRETNLSLLNPNTFFNALFGIEDDALFENYGIELDDATKTALKNLDSGRNIITTHLLRLKFGLQLGDTLTFEYGGKQFSYSITGFVNTNYGIGHVGYVSSKNFMADTGITDFTSFYIRANGTISDTQRDIRNRFNQSILRMETLDEIRLANVDKVDGIVNSISLYTLVAIFVGVFGIGNNIAASFLSRQRLFAIYRTVGTSLRQTQSMLFFETMWTLVLGLGSGLAMGLLLVQYIPFLVSLLWGLVEVTLPVKQLALLSILTTMSMFLAALVPYTKMKKFSVMQNIRQE